MTNLIREIYTYAPQGSQLSSVLGRSLIISAYPLLAESVHDEIWGWLPHLPSKIWCSCLLHTRSNEILPDHMRGQNFQLHYPMIQTGQLSALAESCVPLIIPKPQTPIITWWNHNIVSSIDRYVINHRLLQR